MNFHIIITRKNDQADKIMQTYNASILFSDIDYRVWKAETLPMEEVLGKLGSNHLLGGLVQL